MQVKSMCRKANKINYLKRILSFLFALNVFSVAGAIHSFQGNEKEAFLQKEIFEGQTLRKNGFFQDAVRVFEKMLATYKDSLNNEEQIQILMELGLLNWNLGKMPLSESYYRRAHTISQTLSFLSEEQACRLALEIHNFYSQGKDLRSKELYKESIASFSKALQLSRDLKSPDHIVKCLRQMSACYWETNNFPIFYKLNGEALQISRDTKNKKEEGACLNNIGLYCLKTNNYLRAISYLRSSLDIADLTDSLPDKSNGLTNLGLIYYELGDYDKAYSYAIKVLEIDRGQKNEYDISIDLNNLGIICKNRGLDDNRADSLSQAKEFYQESLALAKNNSNKKIECSALNNIGEILALLNRDAEALDTFHQGLIISLESGNKGMESQLSNNLGRILFKFNRIEAAKEKFDRAISIALPSNIDNVLWEAYFGLAQCFERRGDFNLALESAKKSIHILDQMRRLINVDTYKTSFLRNKLRVFEYLIRVLWTMKKTGAAPITDQEIYFYMEKAKSRAFLESLAESKIDILENLSEEQLRNLNMASHRVATTDNQLFKTRNTDPAYKNISEKLAREESDYLELISKIKSDNPDISKLILPEISSLRTVQDTLLDESTALIEYLLGEQESYVVLVTKAWAEIVRLPDRKDIEKSLKAYLKWLSTPPQAGHSANAAAHRIFLELLSPLKKLDAAKIKKLLIIPDGILYFLPFETLVINERNQSPLYLIDQFQVAYAPSASILIFLENESKLKGSSRGLLAFGDPVTREFKKGGLIKSENFYDLYENQGFDFSAIPFSRNEIFTISRYFPKTQRHVFLGLEATKENLIAKTTQSYQVIHFACHSLIDEQNPLRSALVLSQQSEFDDDFLLQVRELFIRQFKADLVVLSACQTGKGALENIEGLIGLPRIFFYAGARSVISTLWPINDKSTGVFMNFFYNLLSRGFSKAQALQHAKISMQRSKYAHPYYWAGFILSGESNSKINFN